MVRYDGSLSGFLLRHNKPEITCKVKHTPKLMYNHTTIPKHLQLHESIIRHPSRVSRTPHSHVFFESKVLNLMTYAFFVELICKKLGINLANNNEQGTSGPLVPTTFVPLANLYGLDTFSAHRKFSAQCILTLSSQNQWHVFQKS